MKKKLVNPFDWRKMTGENELIKRLNSYLTTEFITSKECPSDECKESAEYILCLVTQYLIQPNLVRRERK